MCCVRGHKRKPNIVVVCTKTGIVVERRRSPQNGTSCYISAQLIRIDRDRRSTAGLVIAATSLLKANAAPDRDAIVAGLEEHLCRCGSHGRVIAAIGRAAKEIGNV